MDNTLEIGITWNDLGYTEAQGEITLDDSANTKVAVNLARKRASNEDFSILQLRINPVKVPEEAIESNAFVLPLDILLRQFAERDIFVNGHLAGMLEVRQTPGPVLDGEGDDFHFFTMEVLQCRVATEDADSIFESIGGKSWGAILAVQEDSY